MAAPSTIVLKYAKPGTKPPVYLAGSFTNPEWTPLPMEWYTTSSDEYEFHKEVTVQEGHEYQYKFRIGEGDWWTLDEGSPTVTDDAGNKNNLLTGPYEYKEPNKDLENSLRPISRTPTLNTVGSNMSSKPERDDQPLGGGDAPTSPVNENIPVILEDHVKDAEAIIREKYDASPTPSKIENIVMANTAAEVADVAATLDKTPQINIDKFDDEDFDDDDSLDSVPLFSHECQLPPDEESIKKTTSNQQEHAIDYRESPFQEVTYDPNDPNIEEFPVEREAIFERIRRTSRNLKEDETSVDLEPPSPVVGPNHHNEHLNLHVPSPHLLPSKHDERSPSLDSIAEEHGSHKEELLASLPEATKQFKDEPDFGEAGSAVESPIPAETASNPSSKQEKKHITPNPIELPETSFDKGDTRELGGDGAHDTDSESPKIVVVPATPGPNTNTNKSTDTANTTAIEAGVDQAQLKHRKETAQATSRPLTPLSAKQSLYDDNSDNAFKKFFKLVFVEWIGGFISRLCGGGRNSLLAITALVLLFVAPALYLSV